jgi:hypothetical protein
MVMQPQLSLVELHSGVSFIAKCSGMAIRTRPDLTEYQQTRSSEIPKFCTLFIRAMNDVMTAGHVANNRPSISIVFVL